jgi:hypothetical protein
LARWFARGLCQPASAGRPSGGSVAGCGTGFLSKRNLKRGSWKGKTFTAPHFLHVAWYEPDVGRASMSQ